MLPLRSKIMGLIILTAIILLGSTFAYHFARTSEENFFNYFFHENSKASIKSILNIKKESFLKSTLNDAAWDEMVQFVKNHQSSWANDNLATIYQTLDLSLIQVYNPRFQLLFTAIDSAHFKNPKIFIPVESLKEASRNHPSFHFFQFHDGGILEIFGASIVPTIDYKHLTEPQGYLVTGRYWDPKYLQNLQNAAISNIEIIPASNVNQEKYINDPKEKLWIVVHRFIHDASGKQLARLDFIPRNQFGLDKQLFVNFTIITIAIAIIGIIFIFFSFQRWVTAPMRYIAQSLNTEEPSSLYHIEKKNKEFFAIADRLMAFFDAKQKLENEIRERKLAEAKIEQYTRELKEINTSKDKFFSILAHDLKSPFHSLLGYTEILANDAENLSEEDRRRYIRILRDSTVNVFDLLENLLQWSRMQSGRMEYHPEILNISDLIHNGIELLTPYALKKNISLTADTIPETLVKGDHIMIRSVLQNLISNAIKFTSSEGKVKVRMVKVDDHIEIIVEDTGTGISEEDQAKLFRIDISFTKKGTSQETGTGLGLILCKELLQKNGGKIWVESVKNEGSAFHFTLPLASST